MVSSVCALHREGYMHTSIHPGNFVLTRPTEFNSAVNAIPEVRLAGLESIRKPLQNSVSISEDASLLEHFTLTEETLAYAAPEILANTLYAKSEYLDLDKKPTSPTDKNADIWSLALVILSLFTDKPAIFFPEEYEEQEEYIPHRVLILSTLVKQNISLDMGPSEPLEERIKTLKGWAPALPEDICKNCAKMLAYNPEKRICPKFISARWEENPSAIIEKMNQMALTDVPSTLKNYSSSQTTPLDLVTATSCRRHVHQKTTRQIPQTPVFH